MVVVKLCARLLAVPSCCRSFGGRGQGGGASAPKGCRRGVGGGRGGGQKGPAQLGDNLTLCASLCGCVEVATTMQAVLMCQATSAALQVRAAQHSTLETRCTSAVRVQTPLLLFIFYLLKACV